MVREMKTRSPQEVMGEAATRSLMGSVVTAACGVIGLLIVSTLGIFFVLGPPAIRKKPEPKPIVSAAAAGTPIADPEAVAVADAGKSGGSGQAADPTEGIESDPVEAMGIGETKDPDSETDTLEKRLDNMLEGLE